MTTIVYFVIGVLALAGAAVLLWLDRQRSTVGQHQRAQWGEQHGFKFRESDSKLRRVFSRATMNAPEHSEVRDVAYGHYGGAEAVVFDLGESATVIAIRRSFPSPVLVDLRHEEVLAPAEEDVELLGAMGPRVMFSNDLDVARRVCDRRMVTLANSAPSYIEVLWNEGNWALGSLPLTNDPTELDEALEVVRRFADLLRVLPPMHEPEESPEPRDPHGPTRAELADKKTGDLRDENRRARMEAAAGRRMSAPPNVGPPGRNPVGGQPVIGMPRGPIAPPGPGTPGSGQRPTPIRRPEQGPTPIERPGLRRPTDPRAPQDPTRRDHE